MKIDKLVIFLAGNWFFLVIFVLANAVFGWLNYRNQSINSELELGYSTYQNKGTILLNEKLISSQISNAVNADTKYSRMNLDGMTLDEFKGDTNNQDLANSYQSGKVDFLIYWNSVLNFYDKRISSLVTEMHEDGVKLSALYRDSDYWNLVMLIYSIVIVIPVNIFLSIIVSKRLDKIFK